MDQKHVFERLLNLYVSNRGLVTYVCVGKLGRH